MLKVAFDIGGVLSKHPKLIDLLNILFQAEMSSFNHVQIHIISDMHPKQKIIDMLSLNGIILPEEQIHSANYSLHGEMCKAVLCKKLDIDIIIDDFPGYVASGKHVRLLVMPEPQEPYYHDNWKTDGTEGDFGRRKK